MQPSVYRVGGLQTMSHDIMVRNGVAAMAAVQHIPVWHELGQRIQADTATWEQMAKAADLMWDIVTKKVYSRNPQGNVVELPDVQGIFRTDDGEYVGSVGPIWYPIQNREAFAWVDTILEKVGGSHYVTAGALGKGERIWTLAKVPMDFEIDGGDKHETYLLFTMAHDGSGAAKAKLVTTRVVCNNTLQMALGEGGAEVSVRHTRSASERMVKAAQLLKGVGSTVKRIQEKLAALAERKLTREKTVTILDRLFPKVKDAEGKDVETTRRNNIVSDVLKLYEDNDRNAFPSVRGTGYNLLNAVVEYTDHVRGARQGERESLESARAESALFGSGEQLKNRALSTILDVTAPNGKELLQTIVQQQVSAG